ncbi:SNF2-related protein, partial [Pseudomonas sp. Kh7]|uniref:SNF2-related protein n=1 Tax=Pseudomonas sp. Kh7 TaxID=2093743 RepID=UPI001186694E
QILHKSDLKNSETLQYRAGKFLYITTYGMALRLDELKNINWDYIILDEAQAIKNPGTHQPRATQKRPARGRIALTGTPLED